MIFSHTSMYQLCPLLSRQNHRIAQGTPPRTSDPGKMPSVRLCIQHHQGQRGGPPSWGQGTRQRQDGHQWHTRERHCIHPGLSVRARSHIHTGCTIDDCLCILQNVACAKCCRVVWCYVIMKQTMHHSPPQTQ